MLKSSFAMGKYKYEWPVNSNGNIYMKRGSGGSTDTHHKIKNGKVYYYGRLVSDSLDQNTLMAIAMKTFG